MLNRQNNLTVSFVRTQFSAFFERVMVLYNLSFVKREKAHKVEDVKRFATELFGADRINEYVKNLIDETIQRFLSLLPGKRKRDDLCLEYLDIWVSLATTDINSEIDELIH